MTPSDLRVALFSGNYNMVADGANQALNRLVGHLLAIGAAVRVYSPTIADPAFAPVGDLVSLASVAIPLRPEYRLALGLGAAARADLAAFAPNIIHVSSPDRGARAAQAWGAARGLPVAASVHTRFETYARYYGLGFAEPFVVAWLRRLYRRCDCLLPPSDSFADVLRAQGMNGDIRIWARGIDAARFNPARRDLAWRRGHGIADDAVVIGFLGRIVLEKGLDVFADTIAALIARGVDHRVLVVGKGPAADWLAARLPGAVFTGFQGGDDLGRAVASMDILLNPSVTEAFGNVTLEAMACGVPVVAAAAAGASSIIADGINGRLIAPGDVAGFADALAAYCADPALRARHGAAGIAHAAAQSWDRINQTVADTYIDLIARRRGA